MAPKHEPAEDYSWVYYGINARTSEVEHIWLTRGGTLAKEGHLHAVLPGRNARDEVAIKFGLTDIFGNCSPGVIIAFPELEGVANT
jgi:hypothetical protein